MLYEHRFTPYFGARWEARSYLEHQVYLTRNLSGDNRWTRIWQLRPQLFIEPLPSVSITQSFGVRATYIDYDFPETLSKRKSIVFRDFFAADSITASLSRQTTLNLYFKLALEERGLLDWDRWLQSPQISIRRHWLILTFRHELARHWLFAPGASYYRETQWKFLKRPQGGYEKQLTHGQTIVSPLLELSYLRPPHAMLILSARRQLSHRFQAGGVSGPDVYIDTFNLTIQWAF